MIATRNRVVGDQVVIYLASLPGVCSLFQTKAQPPSRDFDMVSIELNISSGELLPGVKTVVRPLDGGGTYTPTRGTSFYSGNRNCTTRYGGLGSGTVNILTLDTQRVVGTYELSFATGWPFGSDGYSGSTKGSFDAPLCDLTNKLSGISCN